MPKLTIEEIEVVESGIVAFAEANGISVDYDGVPGDASFKWNGAKPLPPIGELIQLGRARMDKMRLMAEVAQRLVEIEADIFGTFGSISRWVALLHAGDPQAKTFADNLAAVSLAGATATGAPDGGATGGGTTSGGAV